MVRKLIYMLLFMGILILPSSAFAANYIGVGFFRGTVDYADSRVGMFDDIRPFGGVIRLGTYLTPHIAVEVRYMDVSGKESESDIEGGEKTNFNLLALSGLVKLNIPKTGEAQLYGLLGWTYMHLDAANVSDKHNGVSFGFGIEADMTQNTFLSIEYNHVVNVELCDVAGWTILVNGRF